MTTRRACLESSSDESELSDNDILTISEMSLEENPQTWLCCLPGDNPKKTCDLSGWINYSVPCNGDKFSVGNMNNSARQSTGGETSSLGRRKDVTSRGFSLFNSKAKDIFPTPSYSDIEYNSRSSPFSGSTKLVFDTKLDLNRNWKCQKDCSILSDVSSPSYLVSPDTPSPLWSEGRTEGIACIFGKTESFLRKNSSIPSSGSKITKEVQEMNQASMDLMDTSMPSDLNSTYILNGALPQSQTGTIVLKRRSDTFKLHRGNNTLKASEGSLADSEGAEPMPSQVLGGANNETFEVPKSARTSSTGSSGGKAETTFSLYPPYSQSNTGTIVLKRKSNTNKSYLCNSTFNVPDSGQSNSDLEDQVETLNQLSKNVQNTTSQVLKSINTSTTRSSDERFLNTTYVKGGDKTEKHKNSCRSEDLSSSGRSTRSSDSDFQPHAKSTPIKSIPHGTFKIPKNPDRSISLLNRAFSNISPGDEKEKSPEQIKEDVKPDSEANHVQPHRLNSHDDDNISSASDSSYASSTNLIRSLDDVRTLARQQEESLKDCETAVKKKPHSHLKMMGSKKYDDIPRLSNNALKFEIVRSHEVLPTFTQPSDAIGNHVGGITKSPDKKDIYRSVQSLQYNGGPSQRVSKLPCLATSRPKLGAAGQIQPSEKAVSRIPVKRRN